MAVDLNGIFVPVITPFNPVTNAVDYNMLRRNIEKLNYTNIRGYMPLGSNGEFFMLNDDEAYEVTRVVKEAASPDKLVFTGTGRESTKETISFTKKVAELGIDAVFILTPHYFPKQITQECLVEFYTKVADESPLPIILYSAPGYAAGVNIEPNTVKILSSHNNIIGIKDTSALPIEQYLNLLTDVKEFFVLSGTFGKFLDSIRKGASGGVLSSANYIPELCCSLYALIKEGKYEKAEKLNGMLGDLAAQTTAPAGVSGVKAAMNLLGYTCGSPRHPLKPVEDENLRKMELTFEQSLSIINELLNED